MNSEHRKVTLELREYDALWLFALVVRKTYQTNRPWRPYWEYLARHLEQSIGQADLAQLEGDPENESCA
jgi:hypothetical protein